MTSEDPNPQPPRSRYWKEEPWNAQVPSDLFVAVKHLRTTFNDAHWGCGQTTRLFCYALLHKESVHDPRGEYLPYLGRIRAAVGTQRNSNFTERIRSGKEASIFSAFYDLYLAGILIEALQIFKDLVEIALENKKLISAAPLEWAEAQTSSMIRTEAQVIRFWVRNVCDEQLLDPDDHSSEKYFWLKWQAPMFLIMKPLGNQVWDASLAWERNDSETSSTWLNHFEDHYVQHLEYSIRKEAGLAAVQIAKGRLAPSTPPSTPPSAIQKVSASPRKGPRVRTPTAIESLRRTVIFGAIQSGSKGTKYCKVLDDRNLPIPSAWIDEGCPPTYSAAYRVAAGEWRKRIQDEKSRYAKRYRDMPSGIREKLVQQSSGTRRTRL